MGKQKTVSNTGGLLKCTLVGKMWKESMLASKNISARVAAGRYGIEGWACAGLNTPSYP